MAGIITYVAKHSHRQTKVVDELKRRIVSGDFPPGSRLPTQVELAEICGACHVTVQRAIDHLRENGFVETRGRHGTYVANHPPHLSRFGIVFPAYAKTPETCDNQFIIAWHREATRFFAGGAAGRVVSFFYKAAGRDASACCPDLLAEVEAEHLAGVIFTTPPSEFEGSPIINDPALPKVGFFAKPLPGATWIKPDSYVGMVLDYLEGRGRRRVAFMTHAAWNPAEKVHELSSLTQAHGMVTYPHWIQGVNFITPAWAANVANVIFHRSRDERPDAFVIMDDNLVPHATAGLLTAGVRVPEDVDVVAHANFPYPTPSAVPAKRVGYSIRAMLEKSVEIIELKRQGKEVPSELHFPPLFDDEIAADG